MKQKNCRRPACKKPFEPKVEWQKYCSDKCRDAMTNKKRARKIRQWRKIAEERAGSAA